MESNSILADEIYKSLIPGELPKDALVDMATYFEPSFQVGGDFYDCHIPDENHLALIMGDVSGKGISAAMHTAEIKAIFDSLSHLNLAPSELMAQANQIVSKSFERSRFATLVYLSIDKVARELQYIRAGHCPLLYYSAEDGVARFFEDEGIGLGIIRDNKYIDHVHVYKQPFKRNDVVVLFSDGLEESTNCRSNECFGLERIRRGLLRSAYLSAEDIKDAIVDDFRCFVKGKEQLDDLTLIVLKFAEGISHTPNKF